MRTALLIPCHNAAAFLPRLWETIRAQTLPFDAVFCYDDASDDDTAAVAEALGAQVIRAGSNGGPARARNALLHACRAEWVHFHDADDLLTPGYHARVSAAAVEGTDAVLCNALWRDERTGADVMAWRYSNDTLQRDPVGYLLSHPVGGINGYYRRGAVQDIGGFDERLRVWEDADLHVRLAQHGKRLLVVEEDLVIALRRGNSQSAPAAANWRNRLLALRTYAGALAPSHRPLLRAELERCTRELVCAGDITSAREAIALTRTLGGDPPSTGNLLLSLCKRIAGPLTAFRIQAAVRKS
jgi:glycosyltransferase involved in cell wall biosynthesis